MKQPRESRVTVNPMAFAIAQAISVLQPHVGRYDDEALAAVAAFFKCQLVRKSDG